MKIDINIREDILQNFPNFEYFNCKYPERLIFSQKDNLVGQQQEAFILYWVLKQSCMHGGVGIDVGSGQDPHIFSIGINDYHGDSHPIYGGKYCAHITSLAEDVCTKLNYDTFSWCIMSHILEHVSDPIVTFRNCCKLLRKDGVMILIMPDKNFEIFGWDPTHKTYWSADDFKNKCIIPNSDIIDMVELDTFNNQFSFNFIGRRI